MSDSPQKPFIEIPKPRMVFKPGRGMVVPTADDISAELEYELKGDQGCRGGGESAPFVRQCWIFGAEAQELTPMPGLFGGGSKPAPPAVAVAPPMPDQQSPQVQEANANQAIIDTQRNGRASTVLGTQATSTAADSFTAPVLGSSQ